MLKPNHILLVEDDTLFGETMKELLESSDYRVTLAGNGKEALKGLLDEPPDMIVTDGLMPEMDGFELARYVNSAPHLRHIPVVFLTGDYKNEDEQQLALESGVHAVLTKPISHQDLMHALDVIYRSANTVNETGALTKAAALDQFNRTHTRIISNKLTEKVAALQVEQVKLKQSEENYRQLLAEATHQHSRLKSTLDNMNDAVIITDDKGAIVNTNSVASRMFEYQQEELIGQPIEILMPEPYASKHREFMAHYHRTGQAKIIGIGRQLPGKRKSGKIFQMELSLTKSEGEDFIEYIGIIRDISERIEAQDTIYNLAYIDSISGLKNKHWFEKECKDLLIRARLQSHYIHAFILDIDKLAQFNLQFGFDKGNEAVKQIANKLKQALPEGGSLYKNGADSFLIIYAGPKHEDGSESVEHAEYERALRSSSNFKVCIKDIEHQLSASLGCCILDANSHHFESILDTLEHTLRVAKSNGPYGFYCIDEAGIEAYNRIKRLKLLLDSVVVRDELRIVLQPQFNATGDIVASESLIRWHSSELGFISPADFIPIAEETDVIVRIGDWVLEQVCSLLKDMQAQGIDTTVAVNISAKQIVAPDFEQKLLVILDKYSLTPKNLMLELTETALVSDIELVKRVMQDLKQKGFSFSIDDFGTGYSSLGYLKELPISELKIDKYFVDDIASKDNASGENIVTLIIDMAKTLGVKCVAEGVESQEQVDFLKRKGCDVYQGYFFSKPLEVEDWRKCLKDKESRSVDAQ